VIIEAPVLMQIYRESCPDKVNVQLKMVKERLIFSIPVFHFHKFDAEIDGEKII
jgi:hypothetical protein